MNTMNSTAFSGDSAAISRKPTAPPSQAPMIGIKAVTPMKAPTGRAYGNLKISMPMAVSDPRMKASTTCPAMKLLNMSSVTLRTYLIFLRCFSLINARPKLVTCWPNFSLADKI